MNEPVSASRLSAFTALVLLAAPAAATEWTEIPYDPPVGSRWIVQSESRGEQNRGDVAAIERFTREADTTFENRSAIEVKGGITRSIVATSKRLTTIAGQTQGSSSVKKTTVTEVATPAKGGRKR